MALYVCGAFFSNYFDNSFGIFNASSEVESTNLTNILEVAYYFHAFMLNEWEGHLYIFSFKFVWELSHIALV